MRVFSLAVIATGLIVTCQVHADQYSGPYFGASFGEAQLKVEDTPFNESDSAFKAFVGYAFSDVLALEAAYIDGGTPTLDVAGAGGTGTVEASLTGVAASILLRARKGSAFAFFLKLGYAMYDVESVGSVNGAALLAGEESQEDVTAGVGASYLFAQRVMVRLEYEALNVDDADFNIATLGVGYKF